MFITVGMFKFTMRLLIMYKLYIIKQKQIKDDKGRSYFRMKQY